MTRCFVIGDPQGPFAKVLDVLDRHGALAGDRLADDVVLVSIGDHFDYDHREPATARSEGVALLRWLASHDRHQVVLLLGNHDAARVMELAGLDDSEFARAQQLASSDIVRYHAEFPTLPPPGVVARDYASFSVEQRELVQALLLSGRFQLATTCELDDGRTALLTHAGVTLGQLALLALSEQYDPHTIARALNAQLAYEVEAVRAAWQRGHRVALSLAPWHAAGGDGREGGGLLYHRPSNPARYDEARQSELFSVNRARRFTPHHLPRALVQVCGHSGHAKCREELGEWCTPAAAARQHGGLRTLRVVGDTVIYDVGLLAPSADAADLILIDGELRRVPATEVELLRVRAVAGELQ